MRPFILALTLLLGSLGINSCDHITTAREIDMDPKNGMKKGPGLLTGRSGVWTVLRK
jgi:hypothetical protein